jgi:uncharacterized protein
LAVDSQSGESARAPGPSGTGWREETVSFNSNGAELQGIITIPDSRSETSKSEGPGVLVLHGWGSYRSGPHRMLVEACRELAGAGLVALRFDFSGRGDSTGDYWDTDLDVMIADAGAAAEVLCARTGSVHLAALGLCSGANVALGAAARDSRFRAVCALSALPFQKQRRKAQGATRARSTLRELLLKAFRAETYRRLFRGEIALGRIAGRLLRGEGGKSARAGESKRNLKESRRDIQSELAGYQGRLLFVYGAADAEGLSGWRGVLGPFLEQHGVKHRQTEIPGADHDYHGLSAKQRAISAAVEFLIDLS